MKKNSEETKLCKKCKEQIHKKAKKCPHCGSKQGIATWLIVVIVIFVIALLGSNGDEEKNNDNNKYEKNETSKVTVVDFSEMTEAEIDVWCDTNKINCFITEDYSENVIKGGFISQSVDANRIIYEGDEIKIVFSLGKEPTVGQKNALKKAKSYSSTMHMSKAGIYKQLTSEYGERFTAEEAQYAIDNIKVDWKMNALKKAESYSSTMHMSKVGIYKQLTSEYGEEFTAEEAQYAIDNIKVDWNANALAKAKSYQTTLSMSKSAIYQQLISEYGEGFTAEEAQYAIDHLED